MGPLIAIDKPAGVISRRTVERLFRLQREHEGLVRAIRARLARGATIEECGLHFELSSGRLLVSRHTSVCATRPYCGLPKLP